MFLAFSFCGIISCILLSYIIVDYNRRHTFDNSKNQISTYVSRLSSDLALNRYWDAPEETEMDELAVVSETYRGRVVVADATLTVVFDSYHTTNGKTIVQPEAVNALLGKESFECDYTDKTATYVLPLKNPTTDKTVGVFMILYPVNEELSRYETSRRFMILGCLSIAIVIVMYAVVRSLLLTRPLAQINRELQSIANGNDDGWLSVQSNRQSAEISDSVNQLLRQTRMTEQKRQDFISDVSHELKTPMTSMKVLSDALLMSGDDALPPTVREFLTDINAEIDRENHIISDLLTLARMDKRTDTVRFERAHINETLDLILKRVRPLAQKKEIEVVYEGYRDVYAEVDEAKLLTAITNLVENAILYNREQGSVHVTLNANMSHFFITVQDTGYGIAEQEISHIFERFYRVDKDRSRETGGTGLGLAITREIISAHNGQIKVYSKVDEGTTFSVRVPLTRPNRNGRNA